MSGELFGTVLPEVPRLPATLVPREDLMRRLDTLAALTVLQTLAGHGTTTLVAAWARRRIAAGDRVIWADPATRDVAGTWTEVEAAVAGHDGRTILVLDHARLLQEPRLVTQVCDLLRSCTTLHVVACGVAGQALLTAARRVGVDISVIAGRDLAIGPAELPDFAAAWGHRVDPDQLARLHELVGGHLVPLQIALAGCMQRYADPDLHAVRDALQRGTIARVAEIPLLQVASLLALSKVITPRVADAALAVTGLDGSGWTGQRVIVDLWVVGLVHRVHGEDDVWAYPVMIREALADALSQSSPDTVARGHHAIGRSLHADRADVGRILRHARRGRDWSLLAHLWCERSMTLLAEHPTDSLTAFGHLPEEALAREPILATPEALLSIVQPGSRVRLPAALRRRRHPPGGPGPTPAQIVDDAAAAVIVHRSRGDVAGALRIADDAADVAATMPDDARGVTAWFQLQWAITELVAGDFPAAVGRLNLVHEATDRTEAAFIAASAAAHLALLHALSGATAEATAWLAAGESGLIGVESLEPLVRTPDRLARALLALDELDGDAAQAALDQIRDHTGDELWMCVAYVMTQHALTFGSVVAMRAHLEHVATTHVAHLQADGAGGRILQQCRCDVLMALGEANRAEALIGADGPERWMWTRAARLRLLSGDHDAALELAASGAWHPGSTVRDQVDQLMIRAAAASALGGDLDHAEAAAQAHALADHVGIRRACLLVPRGACGQSHADPPTARRAFPDRIDLVVLTPREKQVLVLMREHASLAGIARSLTVSVNTVKKQSVAIHAKLGVRGRDSALMRAEALGILTPRDMHGPPADQ